MEQSCGESLQTGWPSLPAMLGEEKPKQLNVVQPGASVTLPHHCNTWLLAQVTDHGHQDGKCPHSEEGEA